MLASARMSTTIRTGPCTWTLATREAWAGCPGLANDPIFWLHHCNIDRIWASWIKAGGADPTSQGFKNRKFTFADGNGAPVEADVGAVLDLDALDYDYDRYIDRPSGSPPFPSGTPRRGSPQVP